MELSRMTPKTIELASKWLEIARDDFEMAQIAFDKGKLLYSAFHTQQSTEKSLKGLFVLFEKGQPPYIHDLARLAEELENEFAIDLKHKSFSSELNPFYIKARYPDYKRFVSQSLSKNLMSKYLTLGKEVLQWLEIRLLEANKKSST
jgi:HEPN domain-containing protein